MIYYNIYRADFTIESETEPTESEMLEHIDNATAADRLRWEYDIDFIELRDAENYIAENIEKLEQDGEKWHGVAYEIAEMCGGKYLGSYSLTTPKSKN